jgi:hypothetical protein
MRQDVVAGLVAQRHDVEILTVLVSDEEPQEQQDGFVLTRLELDPVASRLARRIGGYSARARERWTWLERDVPIARVRLAAARAGAATRRGRGRTALPGVAEAVVTAGRRCMTPCAMLEFGVRVQSLAAFGGADEYRSLDAGAQPATIMLRWSARRASRRIRS